MTVEARAAALLQALRAEIALVEAQLEKSRAARGAPPLRPSLPEHVPVHRGPPTIAAPRRAAPPPRRPAPTPSPTSAQGPSASPTAEKSPSPDPSPSPGRAVQPIAETMRAGVVLHFVRRMPFSHSFVEHYLVVDEAAGIRVYGSKEKYAADPQRPLLQIPFWRETRNSRGSRFKRAAVCWPLILPEDCPQATDPAVTYFAVDYINAEEQSEKLVLGARSLAERDAWVQFLTKYIDLYLAPRAQSEELQFLTRGAAVPQHKSAVIDGEAPGGNVL